MSESTVFVPSPLDYAAIRMDPAAMVQHLDDPLALEATQNIHPKTYLVHLSWVSKFLLMSASSEAATAG